MINNPFYYGEFEYPVGSGRWYKGSHEPLISKEVFYMVQDQKIIPIKAKWGSKGFAFKQLIKCASCGAYLVGEEKFKKLKDGTIKRHVYYHCSRQVDNNCKEPYIREENLIEQLITFIDNLDEDKISITGRLKFGYYEYKKIAKGVLKQQNIEPEENIDIKSYAKYVLREGNDQEKADLIKGIKTQLHLYNRTIN
jgi:hypothetical protein